MFATSITLESKPTIMIEAKPIIFKLKELALFFLKGNIIKSRHSRLNLVILVCTLLH